MMRRSAVLLCAVTLLAGCQRPAPAPVATAPPAVASHDAAPACPDGYTAVSSHEATAGVDAGHGFIVVRYQVKGRERHLYCTPSTNVADPRRNTPAHNLIPDSESTKAQ
jgi:hypothetical protein